ncbi:MAG TPA: ABC transporter substrate-binding protein [Gaiellaceae bacterium]|nr:ABC transporter substrate-binding protein [Gaiellaceae bacterium]
MLAVLAACGSGKKTATAEQPAQIAKLTVGFTSGGNIPRIANGKASVGVFIGELGAELAFHLTADGTMHPWLVTSSRQTDPTHWEYQVRKGVKFWDGNELTAADVAASWNWVGFSPGTNRGAFFKNVKSITAPSRYVVRVTMKTPDATWRTVPAQFFMGVYEKTWLDKHSAHVGEPKALIMGTGPWIPSNFNPTSGVDFRANPDYWRGAVPFKKIRVNFYTDEQGLALAARSGDIDLALSVSSPETFAKTSGGWKVTTVPTCGVGLISMPTKTPPFDDVHVRRAIAYAINREDILKATGGTAIEPTDYLITPGLLQLLAPKATVDEQLEDVPTYPFSVEKAKQELAKSKVPNGFATALQEPSDPNTLDISQVIAAQLKAIGIDVKVRNMGTAPWYSMIAGPPDKRAFLYTGTGACQPDPSWEVSLFLGSSNIPPGHINTANWAPPEVDTLIEKGVTASDPADRLDAYIGIQKAVNTEVPYVPLYQEGASYASDTYVWTDYSAYWTGEPWALFLKPKSQS